MWKCTENTLCGLLCSETKRKQSSAENATMKDFTRRIATTVQRSRPSWVSHVIHTRSNALPLGVRLSECKSWLDENGLHNGPLKKTNNELNPSFSAFVYTHPCCRICRWAVGSAAAMSSAAAAGLRWHWLLLEGCASGVPRRQATRELSAKVYL